MMKALIGMLVLVTVGPATQWHVLSHAGTERLTEVQFADTLRGWTMADHCLSSTTSRGRTWAVERSFVDTLFAGLAVVDTGHVVVSYSYIYYPRYLFWFVWIDELAQGSWVNRFYHDGMSTDGFFCSASRLTVVDSLYLWHLGREFVEVRTTDGGSTWMPFGPFSYHIYYDASFIDSLTGWAATGAIEGTANAGDSWVILTPDLGSRRIQMFDTLSGWVLTTSGLLHTMDGWASWDTAVAESGLQAMRFCNPRHGLAVGSGGAILHTTDAGVTWQRDTTESSLDLYAVWMVDSVHAWAAGDSGIVLGMGDWALPGIEEQPQLRNPPRLAGVWPNPCRGTLWVQNRGGLGRVVVYDYCGRPAASVQCTSPRAEKLDLRSLPAGIYFARVTASSQPGIRFVLVR
jgi:hypothetical protein